MATRQIFRSTQQLHQEGSEDQMRSGEDIELMMLKDSNDHQRQQQPQHEEDNHLARWVRNSHQIPPPDQEIPIEEWTAEELAARTPMREAASRDFSEGM